MDKEFKKTYNDHIYSFKNSKHSTKTALSKYVWELKDSKIYYSIKWSILKRAGAYNGGAKFCNLCLAEKKIAL